MRFVSCAQVIVLCATLALAQKSTQLYGYVKYSNGSPASGVVLTLGNYSVTTDKSGYYKMTFLRPGRFGVSVTPPGKKTVTIRVVINSTPTKADFTITW